MGPQSWTSEPMADGKPEWVELSWPAPISIHSVHLTFNDDVNEDLINLHHHRTPFLVIPELVKNYRIEAQVDGAWVVLDAETSNRKRKRIHPLDQPIETSRLRVVIESTNGGKYAELVEIRVYDGSSN
ncbi:hypothetical protein D3C73_1119150 [compost metagenome]